MRSTRPILVVDDDDGLRHLLGMALRDAGYDTREARTGEEAVRQARLEQPLLAVVDVRLPGLCGYEVCRSLRDEFGDDLPIVLMSGERTESFDRVAGLLLGADDYMVKPFAIDELIARVRRLTRRIRALPRSVAAKLTARELEVLRLLATGMSPVEIADELSVSPKTVRTHTEHIFLKLGAQSRAQVVAIAYRDNLLEPLTPAGATVRAAEPADGEARRALSSSRDGA